MSDSSSAAAAMAMAAMQSGQFSNPAAQFPDVLQFLPAEEFRKQVEMYANDADMINKKGNMGGYTPLHWACIKNEFSIMKYLVLECKASVDTKGNLGETPLFICVKNCNFLAIEFLISNGANVEGKDIYERSVVHWAAYTGKTVMLHYFKKYHKLHLNETDQFKQHALHIACACGHTDLARYLMNSKEFNYYDQDFNGNTVLHMAVKVGLGRTSWLLYKNSGRRLLNTKNKLQQTPYEMIALDTGAPQKKLADWLKFESKNYSDSYTSIMVYGSWLWRLTLPFYIYTLPLILNFTLFNDTLSGYKGLLGYGSLLFFLYFVRKQAHRISHVSGLQNPFFLGFFICVFLHNYVSYYTYYFGTLNVTDMHQLWVMFLTVTQSYSLIRILVTEPGYKTENVKKNDGSDFELRDLFRTNAQSGSDEIQRENVFCEPCCLVINKPTKHCKLCEHCIERFDHHCLFLVKCIGINNHRVFILLLASSIACIITYMLRAFHHLRDKTRNLPEDAGGSVIYFFVSCTPTIWLTILIVTNVFGLFMLSFLLIFQLSVLSHGFTAQFKPFDLKSMNLTFTEKLRNLKIFFFDSNEKLMELYVRQARAEYYKNKRYSDEAFRGEQQDKLLGGILGTSGEDDETNSFAGFNRKPKGGGHGHDCSSHGHSH